MSEDNQLVVIKQLLSVNQRFISKSPIPTMSRCAIGEKSTYGRITRITSIKGSSYQFRAMNSSLHQSYVLLVKH